MVAEDALRLRPRAAKRHRVSVIGIIGELFISAGVLVLLFLGWQLWLNDLVVGNQQNKQASQLSQSWGKNEASAPVGPQRPDPGAPVVGVAPANAVSFATLIVPRFGADYQRPIAEGIGVVDVLNGRIGHYPGTQMPGAVGNVAIAGHRTTWGAPFTAINELQVGDSIYIETPDGWYKYIFRSLEFVQPTGVGVLDAVPQSPSTAPTDRLLTITSCNPKFSAAERFVAYSVFDTWYPRAGGAPAEIAGLTQAKAAG